MALTETAEVVLSQRPDRLIMVVQGLAPQDARRCANQALRMARKNAPKMSGDGAKRMSPAYGKGYFGIKFQDPYMWFQENGIKAFTMNSLAGKTIPMWVDDSDGKLRTKNPKIKQRTTESGKQQVLIFRKAAAMGARKTALRRVTGEGLVARNVPASYPGAPGRINKREASGDMTTPGKRGGAIAGGNGGVRWRHPGLAPRYFMNNALSVAAQQNGLLPVRIYVTDASTGVPR